MRYRKSEHRIEMRDGVSLHTTIYQPTRAADSTDYATYPILLQRTPYGCNPYGDSHRDPIAYNPALVDAGYIFVYQDLRSRSMSDGAPLFENLKPAYSLFQPGSVDEVTDAYDTIEWLLTHVEGHNGSVGLWGNSYMGWTALMGAVSGHPNIKAVLSASPPMDIFFEDFNRYGLYTLAYTPVLDWFGTPKHARYEGPWWENQLVYWADGKRFGLARDSYDFYLKQGSLRNFDKLVGQDNYFWEFIKEHPAYDSVRQERNSLQYLRGIRCPVLIVGGWNDEQNLYGLLNSYQTINTACPDSDCRLVMGPWAHGQHRLAESSCYVGDVYFGKDISSRYQNEVELRWLEHHLKGLPDPNLPEATVFDTGTMQWQTFSSFPPDPVNKQRLFLARDESLVDLAPVDGELFFEFVSDPAKPVPYIETDDFNLFPAAHSMTADQRFASKRPDVLTFATKPLTEAVQITGPIQARIRFASDLEDADLFVKLIDVYPMDRQPVETDLTGLKMNGYQQLVRHGCIRTRYREGFEHAVPLVPNRPTLVEVDLLDVCHTFKPGHRIMVQVQSSLFPLFDRNPQRYVDNIYFAEDADFQKATHRVYSGSHIEFFRRSDDRDPDQEPSPRRHPKWGQSSPRSCVR